MQQATLNELKTAWLSAKAAEKAANEERLAVEAAILALMPEKTEGTVSDDDTGISVSYKVTRSVDTEQLQQDWTRLPLNVQSAFRWKADLDTKKFKAIQELDTQAFATLALYVTSKPAKPTITVSTKE